MCLFLDTMPKNFNKKDFFLFVFCSGPNVPRKHSWWATERGEVPTSQESPEYWGGQKQSSTVFPGLPVPEFVASSRPTSPNISRWLWAKYRARIRSPTRPAKTIISSSLDTGLLVPAWRQFPWKYDILDTKKKFGGQIPQVSVDAENRAYLSHWLVLIYSVFDFLVWILPTNIYAASIIPNLYHAKSTFLRVQVYHKYILFSFYLQELDSSLKQPVWKWNLWSHVDQVHILTLQQKQWKWLEVLYFWPLWG